mmetsp:Transcript_52961/g.121604  ORF Transcript_52961/g.121604 Transcript_52961/m.121604 type:complete len:227 (-) Transcript_52961:48-728(-)
MRREKAGRTRTQARSLLSLVVVADEFGDLSRGKQLADLVEIFAMRRDRRIESKALVRAPVSPLAMRAVLCGLVHRTQRVRMLVICRMQRVQHQLLSSRPPPAITFTTPLLVVLASSPPATYRNAPTARLRRTLHPRLFRSPSLGERDHIRRSLEVHLERLLGEVRRREEQLVAPLVAVRPYRLARLAVGNIGLKGVAHAASRRVVAPLSTGAARASGGTQLVGCTV